MASAAFATSRQCPPVRTNSRIRRRSSVSLDDKRGRAVRQLKLITPMSHGRVDAGPRTSPLNMTASSGATTAFSTVWSERSVLYCDDDLYNITDDEAYSASPFTTDMSGFPVSSIDTHVKARCHPLQVSTPFRIKPGTLLRTNAPPTRMSTPSLDGSMTSEELASSECPSTPELEQGSPVEQPWDLPAQLDPSAYALLCKLAASPRSSSPGSPARRPLKARSETQEVKESVRRPSATTSNSHDKLTRRHSSSDALSAMTVPSPTTFFGALDPVSRQAWCAQDTSTPSTGAAERFYQLPWRDGSPERRRSLSNDQLQPHHKHQLQTEQRPSTATTQSSAGVLEMAEGLKVTARQQHPESPIRRTKEWLYDQWAWTTSLSIAPSSAAAKSTPAPIKTDQTASLAELPFASTVSPPITPSGRLLPSSTQSTPSKKAVRFLESVPETEVAEFKQRPEARKSLALQGFEALISQSGSKDAFLHGQARVESSHIIISLFPERQSSLDSAFELPPSSTLKPISAAGEDLKDLVALADRDRKAVEQVQPSVWELQANQHIFGPDLVSSPLSARLVSQHGLRILDYGGGPSCNWGWGAALRYRNSTVFTVPLDTASTVGDAEGPSNHKIVRALSRVSLPFPDNHFDLISARSMHVMLRTRRPDAAVPGKDEYDLVLREFMRVLKPGGYLDFHLMDAELCNPGPAALELGHEFVTTLHQHGYDPQASRYFLPRLRNAGFSDIKRAWIVLPAANVVPTWTDAGKTSTLRSTPTSARSGSSPPPQSLPETPFLGSTQAVAPMTGLVGARAWERWVVGMHRQATGTTDTTIVERLARVLQETGSGGSGQAGWRCLVGWARK